MSKIQIKEVAIPTENPPAGKFFLAIDVADSALYIKDSSGTVTKYAAATSGGIYAGDGTVPANTRASITDFFNWFGDAKEIRYGSAGGKITTSNSKEAKLEFFEIDQAKLVSLLNANSNDIESIKNLKVGTTFTGASGVNVFSIKVGTPPTTDDTDTVQIYTTNGRDLIMRDESGLTYDLRIAASETVEGRIELATQAEVDAGVDTSRAVTPATLQQKIADNVAGLYDHKGAYDAATNTPDLDTSPSGILKGDAYTVSVAGTFFTEALEVGDVIIADQDSPTLLSHWTRVQKNVDQATTTTKGIVELATQAEVDAGTDTDRVVTPATLQQKIDDNVTTLTDHTNTIYVTKVGNDSNNGATIDTAKLTIESAITAASALTPSASNRVCIHVLDAGTYSENLLSLPSNVDIFAKGATITNAGAHNTIQADNDTAVCVYKLENDGTGAAVYVASNTVGTRFLHANEVDAQGSAVGIINFGVSATAKLHCQVDRIRVATGKGISDNSLAGQMHMLVGSIDISGNSGIGIFKGGAGTLSGGVIHIQESGTPTTTVGIDLDAGSADIHVNHLLTDTAWDVAAGATLNLFVSTSTGTETGAGTINVTKSAHAVDTSNPHSVTKSQVGLGNVEDTALSTWAGSSNLTTLGTITTGTWQGTTIAVDQGGTGQTTYTNGQILVGQTTGNTLSKVSMSGDATMDETGAVQVSDLTIASEAQGDILYFNGTNWVRLAPGTSGQYLKTQGAAANPIWDTVSLPWQPPTIPLGSGWVSGVSVFRNTGAAVYMEFDSTSDDEASWNLNLRNNGVDYDGSNFKVRILYMLSANGGGTDDVILEFDYALTKAGDNGLTELTEFSETIDVSAQVSGTMYEYDTAALTGEASAKLLQLSMLRNSTGAGADSFGGDFRVYGIELIKV